MTITTRFNSTRIKLTLLASATLMLAACSDNDNTPPPEMPEPPAVVTKNFEVTITNLTANQPLSPVATLQHNDDVQLWMAGEMASVALEKLAEGGDTSDLSELQGVTGTVSGSGAVGPGATDTISMEIPEARVANLAVITMLVNTNDAFTGVQGIDLTDLAIDESMSYRTMAYDAGTEANSEAKGTMPGPADGGEGFNASREGDVDRVHIHPGVISMDDGLMDSVLSASHRFDNPVAMITITRTK
ncbi:spondin domain-containing protein [Shewanella corallii]|uniref:Spondin domain-containing protein n=1 Tax=Shewanella corallii TaxID=560080 RepID=A0ABT0N894_9GAMM|nr:spondin domain-containing protein [Shewanella corallii]MCL2914679.1 spondin domain-containing protein [Shewanella corallii]